MSINGNVMPNTWDVNRYQIEVLFDCIDQELITDKVKADFGLTPSGEVKGRWRIGDLNKARRHLPDFYDGLPKKDKARFQLDYFIGAVSYLEAILVNCTTLIPDAAGDHLQVKKIANTVATKLMKACGMKIE